MLTGVCPLSFCEGSTKKANFQPFTLQRFSSLSVSHTATQSSAHWCAVPEYNCPQWVITFTMIVLLKLCYPFVSKQNHTIVHSVVHLVQSTTALFTLSAHKVLPIKFLFNDMSKNKMSLFFIDKKIIANNSNYIYSRGALVKHSISFTVNTDWNFVFTLLWN